MPFNKTVQIKIVNSSEKAWNIYVKTAIVRIFQEQHLYSKLFEKHDIEILYSVFKQDNSCEKNISKIKILWC